MVLRRDQTREHTNAAALDAEVVVAAADIHAAHLDDPQPPPLGAVERRELLQRNDSMGQALELEIARLAGAIVGHQYGGPARGEMLLERQELAPVAQRALGQEPHLRQRVEHHPHRFDALDLGQQGAGHFRQLDLGRLEEGVLLGEAQVLDARGELEDRQSGQVPAVRIRHGPELLAGLREGDVESLLAAPEALEQELQPQGGLAGAGVALDEMETPGGQTAAKDMVEPFDASGRTGGGFHTGINVDHFEGGSRGKNPRMPIVYQLPVRSRSERAPALSTGGEK